MLKPGEEKIFRNAFIFISMLMIGGSLVFIVMSSSSLIRDNELFFNVVFPAFILFGTVLLGVLSHLHLHAVKNIGERNLKRTQDQSRVDLVAAHEVLAEEARQRKAAEAALRDNLRILSETQARLLSAGRMGVLGEMASGISHEINNPLTILKGYLYMSQEMLQSDLDQRQRVSDLLVKAVTTCDRMGKIVKGLMAFANESERSEIEAFSVRDCVDRSLSFCRERLVSNGIGLIIDEWSRDILVMARPADLTQVMISLIMNSVEAVRNDETRWIRISARCNYSRVILTISDSGKGIEPKIAQKMFIPFFSTKDGGVGNGMGLSVAKTMINSSGGELRHVPSATNTTFEVEIVRSVDTGTNFQVG